MSARKNGCDPMPQLRTPIRIERHLTTPDTRGGQADAGWETVYATRAERTDLSGSETLRAAQMTATYFRRYKIRYPRSIALAASMRLVDLTDSRGYNIRSITGPDQQNRWITLTCEYVPGATGA
jgi:SPP1 family predicted phage head-tail adaptor